MNDTPSKAAIERACELQGYRADWYFKGSYYDEVQVAQIETVACHLYQVSETAKYGQAFIEQALASFVFDEPTADLAYKAEEGLRGLILPDPEPDVLAHNPVAIGAACGAVADVVFPHNSERRDRNKLADALVTLCREVRGYTPIKDAEA